MNEPLAYIDEPSGLWDLISRSRLTWFEKADLWLESFRVKLALDLTTYYILCCVIGFIQGYMLGLWIIRAISE